MRPRSEFRCPDWTRVVSACRRVEREIRSSLGELALRRQPAARGQQAEPDRRPEPLDRLLEGRRRAHRLEHRLERGIALHRPTVAPLARFLRITPLAAAIARISAIACSLSRKCTARHPDLARRLDVDLDVVDEQAVLGGERRQALERRSRRSRGRACGSRRSAESTTNSKISSTGSIERHSGSHSRTLLVSIAIRRPLSRSSAHQLDHRLVRLQRLEVDLAEAVHLAAGGRARARARSAEPAGGSRPR